MPVKKLQIYIIVEQIAYLRVYWLAKAILFRVLRVLRSVLRHIIYGSGTDQKSERMVYRRYRSVLERAARMTLYMMLPAWAFFSSLVET